MVDEIGLTKSSRKISLTVCLLLEIWQDAEAVAFNRKEGYFILQFMEMRIAKTDQVIFFSG